MFVSAGAHLREKTQTYLKMKADLAAIRAESVVLRRTEQILKSRDEVRCCSQPVSHERILNGETLQQRLVYEKTSGPFSNSPGCFRLLTGDCKEDGKVLRTIRYGATVWPSSRLRCLLLLSTSHSTSLSLS